MKKNAFVIVLAAACAVGTPPAFAGLAFDPSQGFNSSQFKIDFENTNLSSGADVGTVGNVTFGGMVFNPPTTTCGHSPAITGTGCIGNFPPAQDTSQTGGLNPWSMAFGSDIGSLAFGIFGNGGTLDIDLFDGNQLVGGGLLNVSTLGFVQITGVTFDRVEVFVDAPVGSADIMLVDNVQFSAPGNGVPEPGSLALVALALASLGIAGVRRRRQPIC